MRPNKNWNYHPYAPLDRSERLTSPYICRIAPNEKSISVEFFDNGVEGATHTLFLRVRGSEGEFMRRPLADKCEITVDGLLDECDYELYIERDTDGVKSEIRLARTGYVPGKVVNYIHPDDTYYDFSGQYLASPSLLRLPTGRLLSSMDVFRCGYPQNFSLIFCSDDDGESWHYLSEIFPCFWGRMFLCGGRLYMLGISCEYGDLLISESKDEGKSWCEPTVLFRGSAHARERGLHRAPMRIAHYGGRIWTDVEFGTWCQDEMNNAVLSASEDADLLLAESWVCSDFWRHPEFAKTARAGETVEGCLGGIEGNVIEGRDGKLYDLLRYAHKKPLLLTVNTDDPEAAPTYARLIDMPCTQSKFDVEFDEKSGKYYAIISRALDEPKTVRNLLSLASSPDLINWEIVTDLIDYRNSPADKVGFQYVCFAVEGDDILYLSRTAFNGAENHHDSNYQTFHRIKNFRSL